MVSFCLERDGKPRVEELQVLNIVVTAVLICSRRIWHTACSSGTRFSMLLEWALKVDSTHFFVDEDVLCPSALLISYTL